MEYKMDSNGGYLLGPNHDYIMTAKSINHITNGDISERLIRDATSKVVGKELIIKGGLHTAQGWIRFKNNRGDIVHGHMYMPDSHKLWYYARELQNGVILLKIPAEAFQSKAANLTKFADTFYKSGYLWKTLFPEEFKTDESIIAIVNEALHNIDNKETVGDIIIGYANTNHPFKCLKIRIQVIGKNINSAFPTWGQPMTGNNGKPYSHLDTIHFRIAESTKFFDDQDKTYIYPKHMLPNPCGPEDIISVTPEWMLTRKPFTAKEKRMEAIACRKAELVAVAEKLTSTDINSLVSYLKEPAIAKDPVIYMTEIYNTDPIDVAIGKKFKNAVAFYQNQREGLQVLAEYDKINNTNHSIDYIVYFLKQKFIHTGGLDLWETMRLQRLFIKTVVDHPSTDSIARYIDALAFSPCRIGAYVDFDLNPYMGHDLGVVGLSHCEIPLFERHFYDFFAETLGENYLAIMTYRQRLEHAKKLVTRTGKYTRHLIRDCLEFAFGTDLTSFGWEFKELANKIISERLPLPEANSIEQIFNDFHRCKVVERTRVIIENYDILKDEPDLNEFGSKKYNLYTAAKHKRQFIEFSYQHFVQSLLKLVDSMGLSKLSSQVRDKSNRLKKELIPLPQAIPSYIKSWRQNEKVVRLENTGIVPAEYILDLLGLNPEDEIE